MQTNYAVLEITPGVQGLPCLLTPTQGKPCTPASLLIAPFSNSCQLAQGLVNDAASVLPEKVQSDMKMSTISFSRGVTDVFGALTHSSR